MFFSSIEEINRCIKHLQLRETDVLKLRFYQKEAWRNALPLKNKKVQGIFGETFILALSCSAVFRLQIRVSDLF